MFQESRGHTEHKCGHILGCACVCVCVCVCVRVHYLWMRSAADRPSARQAALSMGVTETRGPSTSQSSPSWVHTLASRVTDGIQPLPAKGGSSANGLTTHSERTHALIPMHLYTHTHTNTHTLHVNTTLNTRAYGVPKAHVQAFVPTCLPVHKQIQGRKHTQKHTQAGVSFH